MNNTCYLENDKTFRINEWHQGRSNSKAAQALALDPLAKYFFIISIYKFKKVH